MRSPGPPAIRPLVLAALLLSGACRLMPGHGDPSSTPSPAAAAAESTGPGTLSDANIAAIVLAANNADILYGTLAAAKSANAEVRRFAETTVRDHHAVNQAATDLAARLNLSPQDNTASFDLRDNAEDKRDQLRELEGRAFDAAYLENEVAYHTRLLATIDGALVPAAKNADLKALLVNVRPAVAAHLDHARRLQASLQ